MAVTGIEEVVVAARGVAESSSVHRTITKSDLLEMPVVPTFRSWCARSAVCWSFSRAGNIL